MARRKRQPEGGRSRRALVLGGAVGLGLVLVAVLVLVARIAQSPRRAPLLTTPFPQVTPVPNAVSLTVFFDFQCPYCGQFARESEPKLRQEYIQRGLVNLRAVHFPILGNESWLAAQATECAREQGRFWEYYDALFHKQAGENRGTYSPRNLKAWAREVGLDGAQFDACLDSGRTLSKVEQDFQEGRRLGVNSTPTFIVDGQMIRGLMPWERFRLVLDDALRRRGLSP
ncbi:MAG: DsbA family protein [Dehalococcoidia bacterium]|nr:DsbA family protein [Dehalococcoidia bacterium]MDW8119221.1 thioredoxin domain-containing protein [Chloroflexota bacterium]